MASSEHDVSLHSSPRTAEASQGTGKLHRVLACALCQQRKIKCDRKFPCANCTRSGSQCVPASLTPRQRRRRFPERELLERLRHYENLLRQNNINFKPLHPTAANKASPSEDGTGLNSPIDAPSDGATEGVDVASPRQAPVSAAPVSFWDAMKPKSREPKDDDADDDDVDDNHSDDSDGDMHEDSIKKAWDQFRDSHEHLLFGSHKANVDLSTLRPENAQIFKLWQVYLDNVDCLLKVTHTPTLQARIIDAASDTATNPPTLEALMFSVYCVAVLSLEDDRCRSLFGSPKVELLTRYQFGCQQALLNCEFLRSDDRDSLTALFLYLVSVKPDTDPRSLSSMLGVAMRIAQRMGIHTESTYAKYTALEAEMRRRLWWSLVIFDNRMCEMATYSKGTMLIPTWDCRTPINVNDFEIRPETKTAPTIHTQPSEALFAVVRSEVSNFLRCSDFYLDFTNPFLKPLTKSTRPDSLPEGSKLLAMERLVEDKYLRHCDPTVPLHFMTIWTTRTHFAQYRLLTHYATHTRRAPTDPPQTDADRDTAVSHALRMIECNTQLLTSPLTTGYRWYIHSHFPFPAYIHTLQDLRARPVQPHAPRAWAAMSANWTLRFAEMHQASRARNPFFALFARLVLHAWDARGEAGGAEGEVPHMVQEIRTEMLPTWDARQQAHSFAASTMPSPTSMMNIDDVLKFLPVPMDISSSSAQGGGISYDLFGQQQVELLVDTAAATGGIWAYSADPSLGQATMADDFDLSLDQLDWNATASSEQMAAARGW